MQTIGERLEEARKRKGISVREAAEATKIRSDYLQKFEANSFDLDLPPLYIRGFVRAYARFLELDPERFLAEYDAVIASEGRAPRRTESREVYGRVEFGGEAGGTGGSGKAIAGIDQALLLKYGLLGGGAIVLIVVIIVLVNVFTSHSPAKSAANAPTQPGATAPAVQADGSQILALTAVDGSRVKIVHDSDGKTIFEGALARGETKTFRKSGKLLITVEKGSDIRMEVNGRNYAVPIDGYGRFALD